MDRELKREIDRQGQLNCFYSGGEMRHRVVVSVHADSWWTWDAAALRQECLKWSAPAVLEHSIWVAAPPMKVILRVDIRNQTLICVSVAETRYSTARRPVARVANHSPIHDLAWSDRVQTSSDLTNDAIYRTTKSDARRENTTP